MKTKILVILCLVFMGLGATAQNGQWTNKQRNIFFEGLREYKQQGKHTNFDIQQAIDGIGLEWMWKYESNDKWYLLLLANARQYHSLSFDKLNTQKNKERIEGDIKALEYIDYMIELVNKPEMQSGSEDQKRTNKKKYEAYKRMYEVALLEYLALQERLK